MGILVRLINCLVRNPACVLGGSVWPVPAAYFYQCVANIDLPVCTIASSRRSGFGRNQCCLENIPIWTRSSKQLQGDARKRGYVGCQGFSVKEPHYAVMWPPSHLMTNLESEDAVKIFGNNCIIKDILSANGCLRRANYLPS